MSVSLNLYIAWIQLETIVHKSIDLVYSILVRTESPTVASNVVTIWCLTNGSHQSYVWYLHHCCYDHSTYWNIVVAARKW